MYIVLMHFYGYVKNFLEFVVAYMTVMHYSPDAMEQCKQSLCILFIVIRASEVWQKKHACSLFECVFFIIYANQLCSTLQMGAF